MGNTASIDPDRQSAAIPCGRRMVVLAAVAIALAAAVSVAPLHAEPAAEDRAARESDAGSESTLSVVAKPPAVSALSRPGSSSAPSVGPSSTAGQSDALGTYRALIAKEARNSALAPEIAEAVMAVESGYNPDAIGGSGEIGLMQIMPSTARMLGFIGSNAELAVPETNIHYGVLYLAQAWRLAGGDLCTATMKYRAGHGETRFSYLSVNYCLAVRAKLAARGFAVTGEVPTPTFGAPGSAAASSVARAGGACGRRCLIAPATLGRVDLASLNAKLSTLVVQARAGR
ncbi:transglycosylase SLT domain-containing protein [Bradyrhizobium ontarionense]|uniref:Transglycosylase SLT domain-containing protein n=1 Tax=Bradyrhizobium ontarionense TaxID=2898149 RepID=A0ABY3R7W7_9BRAD|nr:transglycosylase SLT domain-containing protein [Bradyrhizobium sp. A19]UFZ03336.1 transglycosylase SLT domain-containing protein [Bradyrhizobium sp. A19]